MRLVLVVEASADGYDSEEQEFEAIKVCLSDLNSSSSNIRKYFNIKVESCEQIKE